MKNLLSIAAVLVFLAGVPSAWCASVTGAWKGDFEFQGRSVPLTINLSQSGAEVTGSVEGLPTTPAPIQDGKVLNGKVSFWVSTSYQGQTYRLIFAGKAASADEIDFTLASEDGNWRVDLVARKIAAQSKTPSAGSSASAAARSSAPPARPIFKMPPPHKNAPPPNVERFPGNGAGAYATGHYRDLFAEQGHTEAQVHAKIEKAFQQLFHGDGQYQRVYFETGANRNGPLAYITDWANNDVRTEGMSYGMMICVQLNKKREFDALWNWANTYMLITDPKNPAVGYFAWSMNTDGTPRSTGPAPDGEEYFVMSLYFAAHRWGNGKGIYDYQAEADKILRDMRHHPVLTGTGPFRIHPGDPLFIQPDHPWPSPNNEHMEAEAKAAGKPWPPFYYKMMRRAPRKETIGPMVNEPYHMIRFVPNLPGGVTDVSYQLPSFYELWARWGPVEDRAFWAEAADVSRYFFNRVADPRTGLTPNQSNFDGTPVIGFDGKPVAAMADSWRTVSNWSMDYDWWHKDPREAVLSNRLQKFLYSQGIDKFADAYTLDGEPLSNRHSSGMVATTAVGSLAATDRPIAKAFVNALWTMPIPSGEQRYYNGMLYLMSMMRASGEFRIIR